MSFLISEDEFKMHLRENGMAIAKIVSGDNIGAVIEDIQRVTSELGIDAVRLMALKGNLSVQVTVIEKPSEKKEREDGKSNAAADPKRS